MAGDTCQTIAKGVGGFRFEDLRSMFFAERELQLSSARVHKGDKNLVNVPPLLQLGTNYRSHNGILRCAIVVVSRLNMSKETYYLSLHVKETYYM
jgi:hypothetical protein